MVNLEQWADNALRRKTITTAERQALGAIFHARARQQACRILAGHVMPEHGPRGIASPPKHAVASVSGLLQGKRAIAMARQWAGRERHGTGEPCWARG